MARLPCDVRALPAEADAVDALAHLALAARRAGLEVCLCHASPALCCLIEFMGLAEVLRVEVERKPEQREKRLRVEEEGQLRDPPA